MSADKLQTVEDLDRLIQTELVKEYRRQQLETVARQLIETSVWQDFKTYAWFATRSPSLLNAERAYRAYMLSKLPRA